MNYKDTPSTFVEVEKKKFHVGPRARLVLLVTICLVLLAGLAGGSWLVIQKLRTDKKPATKTVVATINGKPLTEAQKSQRAIYYGKYDEGQAILLKQIDTAKTADEKVTIYMQLAMNALNKKKYDEVKAYCDSALVVKKAAVVYSALALMAEQQGNKKQAISYANQQKQVLDLKSDGYTVQLQNINDHIAELSK